MKRRDFLKIGSLTTTTALMSACTVPRPRSYYVPYVEQPEDAIPGVANWYASTCTMCSSGCGLMARVLEGRAVKLEGNPASPINQGKLCALGQSGLQLLYHPDRVRGPMKRTGARGRAQFVPITWDEALAALAGKLRPLIGTGAVDMVTRSLNGSLGLVIDRFVRALNGRGPVALDIRGHETLLAAIKESLGFDRLPDYDLANARYVLSFGADLFGSWLSPTAYGVAYGQMRHGRVGIRGKIVQIEPRMSVTGATADRWVPVNPGTEGMVALAIAHVLLLEGSPPPGFEAWRAPLAAYRPEAIEGISSLSAQTIRKLAHELTSMRPAIALGGGAIAAQTNGVSSLAAIHALNLLVGSMGATGGVRPSAPAPWREFNALAPSRFSDVLALVDRMNRGQIQALLIHQADPTYLVPPSVGFQAALSKVPFVASFSSFIDDTTAHADLILPDHTFLESWGVVVSDPNPARPVASSLQPVVQPVFDTRPLGDVLLSVGKSLGGPVAAALPWASYVDMVKATWSILPTEPSEPPRDPWTAIRQDGVWAGPAVPAPATLRGRGTAFLIQKSPSFLGDDHAYPFVFLPYPSIGLRDGAPAVLPWQQELPEPMSAGVWSSWIEVNPKTARDLGLDEGDPVEIASASGRLRARVHLYPAIHPNVIAMPMGQGHAEYGRYAAGRGSNPLTIIAPQLVEGSGALAWASTRVSVAKVSDAPSFTKVETRSWPPERHDSPGYVSLEDLTQQRWPWDGTHVKR